MCEVPAGGACSSDSDCVVAFCGDWACNCGGSAIALSQLGENPCLIEEGSQIPQACFPPIGQACNCPDFAACTPHCLSGACACVFVCANGGTPCNRLCTNTAVDNDNCGGCSNVCPRGQQCYDGGCG
jgi:hypothetical protein